MEFIPSLLPYSPTLLTTYLLYLLFLLLCTVQVADDLITVCSRERARASQKGAGISWLRGDFANWADFSAVRSCAVRQCLTRCLSVPASVSVVSVTVLQSFLMSRSEKYSGMKNACEIDMSENDCTVLCVHCVCATNLSQTWWICNYVHHEDLLCWLTSRVERLCGHKLS